MKSLKKLISFGCYCFRHPQERFYQALRNWSQENFILFADLDSEGKIQNFTDTFFIE